MTDQELGEIKASAKNHGSSAECLLRLVAEVERLRAEVARLNDRLSAQKGMTDE